MLRVQYPECCSYDSFHPPSPIDRGEEFLRQVYNALRSSPQWDEILFIVTYDEHGGFADHMPIKPAPPPVCAPHLISRPPTPTIADQC